MSKDDRAVTEAVVKMSAQMGMQTIAEGVETPAQQALLEAIGADSAQGFLYLGPCDADRFEAWLGAQVDRAEERGPVRHRLLGDRLPT